MFSMEDSFINLLKTCMKHSLTKGIPWDVGRNYSAQWRSYKGEAITLTVSFMKDMIKLKN
jgi:hypothetical protein